MQQVTKNNTYQHFRFDYSDNELNRNLGRQFFKKGFIGTLIAFAVGITGALLSNMFIALISPVILGGVWLYAGLTIKDTARQFGDAWLANDQVKIKLRAEEYNIHFKDIVSYKMPGMRIRVIIETSDGQKLLFRPPTDRWGYDAETYDLKDDRRWDKFINALDESYQRYLIKDKI